MKVRDFLQLVYWFKSAVGGYGYSGNYANWEQAKKASSGYQDDMVLDKVLGASIKVKKGEAAYERDGLTFDQAEYEWPLLTALFYTASHFNNKLEVLDFGGALGSHYFQHRKMLEPLSSLGWNVVEQEHFVKAGKEHMTDSQLSFFENIDEVLALKTCHILLLGCVLPYLQDPYQWLQKFKASGIPYVLVDKHPVIDTTTDRLTIQRINPSFYKASYPAWFFSEKKFLSFMLEDFELVTSYLCPDLSNIKSEFKGYLFKRR